MTLAREKSFFESVDSARPHALHGGRGWRVLGNDFSQLDRRRNIIPADVLDAWFSPSPRVLEAISIEPAWLCRTSPPAQCEGLLAAISQTRGVDPAAISVGAGSSALIFGALADLASHKSRCLLLDPTYGEYGHMLEDMGCCVEHVVLRPEANYSADADELIGAIRRLSPDLVVLVNPNSPTGTFLGRAQLLKVIGSLPLGADLWADETYIDFVDSRESLEATALPRNVFICKSMSKAYALSGLRVAYLVGHRDQIARVRRRTPPWAISLHAQIAAVAALEDESYYRVQWETTEVLRLELAANLRSLRLGLVFEGAANLVLLHLGPTGPTAAQVCALAEREGVFFRDAVTMGESVGDRVLRIAVRSPEENRRMLHVLSRCVSCLRP